jgi:glycosyltransferase involved in cell wall biosynthesis
MQPGNNSKRVSVVIIGPSQKFLSGISYFTLRLSNALTEFAHIRVILFRNMLPKHLFPGWKRVGTGLMKYEFKDEVNSLELLDWYNPLSWMRGAAKAEKSDIIIFQWWTSSVAHMYLAIALMNWKKKPIVIEFHETVDPLENAFFALRIYSKIMGTLIRHLAKVYVVHSEIDRQLISSHYRIGEKRITVIPHGLYDQYSKTDRDLARKQLQIDEKFVILFFGLLRPYKGAKYLVKAFEMLPPELLDQSRLLIVGEAWEDLDSRKSVEKSPVSSRITMIDRYVGDDEVPLYFSAANVLVLPYTRASQSGVAHIGMAFGLPIIASRVGGLVESLGKYRGTAFIGPGSTTELKDALIDNLSEIREYEPPMELRWEQIADRWDSLIEEICNNQSE